MSKVAISLICKGDDEYNYLKALLRSLRRRTGDVFVTLTSDNTKKCEKLITKTGNHYNYFKWINDFAAARQFGYDALPEEYRYIFTCDADDIIEHAGNLDRIVWDMIKNDADFSYITYVTGRSKEYGDTIVNVPRLVKRGSGHWVRPIHEVWVADDPTRFIIDKGRNVRCIHTKVDVIAGETRNLDMLLGIENKTDEDHRYIASSYIALSKLDKALEHLEQIQPEFGFYFQVLETMAELYNKMGNPAKGEEKVDELVKIYGEYSDPHFVRGKYLMSLNKNKEALESYLKGFKVNKTMPTIMTDSSHNVFINPLGKTVYLYEILGMHKEAVHVLNILKAIAPDLAKVKELDELVNG